MTEIRETDNMREPAASAGSPGGADAVAAPGGGAEQSAAPSDLAALQRECDALREKNLRLLADARNMQQRAAREREEAIKYAEFEFARELVPVLDGLEQTLASAGTAGAAPVAEGVRIVYEQFLKALRARQIERIEAEGKPFDPTFHEAIMQQPSKDSEPGTVLKEVLRGYRMRDRVLRCARVIVSKAVD